MRAALLAVALAACGEPPVAGAVPAPPRARAGADAAPAAGPLGDGASIGAAPADAAPADAAPAAPRLAPPLPALAGFARRVAGQAERFPRAFHLAAPGAGRAVALTFDDGPNPASTRKVLDILAAHDAVATFFVVGDQVRRFPDLVREMAAAGHAVGGHGYRHDDLSTLDADRAWRDHVAPTQALLSEVLGAAPGFFRPPYGKLTDAEIAAFAEKGLVTVVWSIDSCDWMRGHNSTDQIVATVVDHLHDGAIVLFHENRLRATTFAALPRILAELRRRGYALRTVPELLGSAP